MNRSCSFHLFLIASFAVISLPIAGRIARAQSCEDNADCPKGYTCEVVGETGCASAGCAGGDAACPEPEPCVTEEVKECMPGPCKGDTDCDVGMVCLTQTTEQCSGGSAVCTKGQECPEPQDAGCKTVTESNCVPKYLAPCEEDKDCGDGFTCKEQERCVCADSKPAEDSSAVDAAVTIVPLLDAGGDAETPPDDDCSCEPSGEKSCEMKEISCDKNSDCPEGWSCEESGGGDVAIGCAVPEGADAARGLHRCRRWTAGTGHQAMPAALLRTDDCARSR